MFAKDSRYYKLNDVTNTDATGREMLSKPLRLTPDLSAQTYHIVDELDRIDLIAHRYFRKTKKWWRICDANTDYLSPRELLGKEPIVITRFPLLGVDTFKQFPWAQLINSLKDELGVLNVECYEKSQLQESVQNVNGELISLWSERFVRAADITYNLENLTADDVTQFLVLGGFSVAAPIALRRIGSEIAIPSNSSV